MFLLHKLQEPRSKAFFNFGAEQFFFSVPSPSSDAMGDQHNAGDGVRAFGAQDKSSDDKRKLCEQMTSPWVQWRAIFKARSRFLS